MGFPGYGSLLRAVFSMTMGSGRRVPASRIGPKKAHHLASEPVQGLIIVNEFLIIVSLACFARLSQVQAGLRRTVQGAGSA